MSRKVVINAGAGYFGLSDDAIIKCIEQGMRVTDLNDNGKPKDWNADFFKLPDEDVLVLNRRYACLKRANDLDFRSNPILVGVVEEMGANASRTESQLKIVEIPDDVDVNIESEDWGQEWVAEKHRTWGLDNR